MNSVNNNTQEFALLWTTYYINHNENRNKKHKAAESSQKMIHHMTLTSINRFYQVKDYETKRMNFILGKPIGSRQQSQVYQIINTDAGGLFYFKKLPNNQEDQTFNHTILNTYTNLIRMNYLLIDSFYI
ncbi:unnamed protein product (macronuclear) [Paramecium tetraurelia]|uniref:Protein kinase domain-containing protein n=1 Tax=Paramecium tetraurelia TaxID=5888 RepID=A0E3R9_PARTE|nr:uncharacterized protein GSPATT00023109001 [Paramecium tetraurelia]CAK89936.1 unnamed protein product [Paramecium tetraurelia]|eukprot:XP_001457333.1 hypothetical protein (macronuclear) [Paramecium tetraurelia strain d4-2]